jgi:hypothetical protein
MTEEDRKEIQDGLIADASELRLGISMKDPSLVGHVAGDRTYFNRLGQNWLCSNYCRYERRCLQMRAGGEPLIQISGHVSSTKGQC